MQARAISLRVPQELYVRAVERAEMLSTALGEDVTFSDVFRVALADYLSRPIISLEFDGVNVRILTGEPE